MNINLLISLLTATASLGGFFVAWYIYDRKSKSEPMTCPVGHDCHEVVHSKYSKFLGIRVEILGILYYFFIFISNVLLFTFPNLNTTLVWNTLWIISMFSVLFSLYLIKIQAFALKHWCSWCLISALISVIIAILTTTHIVML